MEVHSYGEPLDELMDSRLNHDGMLATVHFVPLQIITGRSEEPAS